ncbi:hydrogenase maturation protease [Alteromonas facilis]|uniref:hydrogenase maturation protease n=1 Tax=Alteromonas facilis TaxID=2048004 RepID=UPI000C287D3F|nr:hydrogenase maturation protease [Alteromonas facilis]
MDNTSFRFICIGNLLHGNDGLGHRVFQQLQHYFLPANVDVIEGGIGGMTLLPLFRDIDHVVIIDIMKRDNNTGEVTLYPDVIGRLPANANVNKAHGGDVTTLLGMLPVYLDKVPMVDLVCVNVTDVEHYSVALEEQVEASVKQVCDTLIGLIEHNYVQCDDVKGVNT